jgi:tetratricopeptide (TPR) repeat protein
MDADDARALFEDAREAYRRGDYRGALMWLDKLSDAYPEDADIRFARAVALEGLGHLDEAVEECDRILSVENDPETAAMRERMLGAATSAPVSPQVPVLAVAASSGYAAPYSAPVHEVPGGTERGLTPEWTIFVIFICAPFLYALAASAYPGLVNGFDVLVLYFLSAYVRGLVALPIAVLAVYAGLTFLSIHHGRAAIDLRNSACACGLGIALAGIPYAGIPIGAVAAGWLIGRIYRMSIVGVLNLAAIAFFVLTLGAVLIGFISLAGTIFVQGVIQFLLYAALV